MLGRLVSQWLSSTSRGGGNQGEGVFSRGSVALCWAAEGVWWGPGAWKNWTPGVQDAYNQRWQVRTSLCTRQKEVTAGTDVQTGLEEAGLGWFWPRGLWYVNFSAQELFTFWGVASKTSFGELPISHVLTTRFEWDWPHPQHQEWAHDLGHQQSPFLWP